MSRWWRAYDDALDNPKLQRLPAELFRTWFNVCCIASKYGGKLPKMADLAFMLRMPEKQATLAIASLMAAGLIDKGEDGSYSPHNWNARQFKSDDVTERVKKHREKRRGNVTCNVSVPLPETPPETETETDTKEADASLEGAGASAAPEAPVIPRRSNDFGNDVEAVALGLKPSASPAPEVPLPGATMFGEIIPPSRRNRSPPRGKHALPDDWEPGASVTQTAEQQGFSDERFRHELAKFRDHASLTARRCADWDAAARNWLRKAAEFVPGARPAQAGGNRGADDSRLAAMLRGAARVRNAHDVPG